MKNIILIVADSLRRDTFTQLTHHHPDRGYPVIKYPNVQSRNSCTELSLPWMLSGMDVYSPTLSIPTDLKKLGYNTLLIHSNAIVDKFKQPFHQTIDLSTGNTYEKLTRKYNKLRNTLQRHLPAKWYHKVKQVIRGNPEIYLPYSRVTRNLITLEENLPNEPYFIWLHLMDPHTPYYPLYSTLPTETIIDYNDNQISAVRGYYTPDSEEVSTWYYLYESEIMEMWQILDIFLSTTDLSNTDIILTSDHGEEFGEHGEYGHKGNRFNPENIDIPFLLATTTPPKQGIKDLGELRGFVKHLAKPQGINTYTSITNYTTPKVKR